MEVPKSTPIAPMYLVILIIVVLSAAVFLGIYVKVARSNMTEDQCIFMFSQFTPDFLEKIGLRPTGTLLCSWITKG
jgi:hypothetical protein